MCHNASVYQSSVCFEVLQCVSWIWTSLTWLNFVVVAWFSAPSNFCYYHSCLKKWCLLQKWSLVWIHDFRCCNQQKLFKTAFYWGKQSSECDVATRLRVPKSIFWTCKKLKALGKLLTNLKCLFKKIYLIR